MSECHTSGICRGEEAHRGGVEPLPERAQAQGGTRHPRTDPDIDVRGDPAPDPPHPAIPGRTGPSVGAAVEFTDELARIDPVRAR